MGGRDSGSFACPTCGHLVFFENFSCLNCGTQLGFGRPEHTLLAQPGSGRARCANAGIADCNWLADCGGPLCGCCALTRTRPADTDQAGMAAFARVEAAKRRLVFQLDELALPTGGVVFDLLSSSAEPVTTGHDDGVVTIDLAEGDDGHREALRVQLAEPYRTLLGHPAARDRPLVLDRAGRAGPGAVPGLFGDERADHTAALERNGGTPPAGWAEHAVSTYATAHPWEDWAETFAHYLHIRDTPADRGRPRPGRAGPGRDPRDPAGRDPDRRPDERRGDRRLLAAADLRAERGEPVDGERGSLPLLPVGDVLDMLRFVHDAVTRGRSAPPAGTP